MPIYTFACVSCGHVFDKSLPSDERYTIQQCKCGAEAPRNLHLELTGSSDFAALQKDHPRWSAAMGCNPEEIPDRMKQYPDRVYHPETGDLLVMNRAHKKQLMREFGYEERR